MVNTFGINGSGKKNCMYYLSTIELNFNSDWVIGILDPPDSILTETLLMYSRQGLKQSQKRAWLILDHKLDIGWDMVWIPWYKLKCCFCSTLTLNTLERRLGIPSVKQQGLAAEEIVQAILDETEHDITQNNGPNYIKSKLQGYDIRIARYDLILYILVCETQYKLLIQWYCLKYLVRVLSWGRWKALSW